MKNPIFYPLKKNCVQLDFPDNMKTEVFLSKTKITTILDKIISDNTIDMSYDISI